MLNTPSIARRVNAERMVVLGWPRAILMQLAHPLVAAGVADHSSFRASAMAPALRLHHTIRAMLALTFADDHGRAAALEGIRAIHRRVHGRLRAATGIFPAGTVYSAEDPDLVLWVHATLLESIPLMYARIVQPLDARQLDRYCEEAAGIAIDLGARDLEVPRTWHALNDYLARMYTSGGITVGGEARELAAAVLRPPLVSLMGPLGPTSRLLTIGLLPDVLRREYGFPWDARQARKFDRALSALKTFRRMLPGPLALWREAI